MICNLDITVTPSEVEFISNTLLIDDTTNSVQIRLEHESMQKIVSDYLDDIDQEEGKEITLKLLNSLTDERQEQIFNELRRKNNG